MTDSFARSTRGARDARHWGLTRRAWTPRRRRPSPGTMAGFFWIMILQADEGCDFDFLRGRSE